MLCFLINLNIFFINNKNFLSNKNNLIYYNFYTIIVRLKYNKI